MKGRRWLLIAVCVFLLGSPRGAYSSPEEQDPFSEQEILLENLIHHAVQANPSIRAARQAWRAALENFRVATGYPDPQLMASYYPGPIETRLGPQDWNVNLTQRIPFPGKLSKAGEVVEAETRVAKLNLDKTVRQVVSGLKESYHELGYIREAKRIARENLDLLNHLRKVGETAYAGDRATLLDMVKAQSQLGQLQYDMVLLRDLEETEITRLNTILDRDPGARIGPLQPLPVQPIPFDLERLYQMAEQNQEDILMARNRIDRAEARVDLARMEGLPDFNVGLFYGSIGKPDIPQQPLDAGRDAVGVQVGMTLPIWFGKNRGRLERAFAEMEMAKEEREVRINQAQEGIRSIFFRLENAKRLISLYQNELLPQAAKSIEIAEVWFRQGESSFSDFVEAQAVWYNFQLTLARARADYGKYLARLERVVGRDLSRRPDPAKPGQGEEPR